MCIYKDGGTRRIEYDGKSYYIDHRIMSKTKGKVYDRYPGDAGAKIVTGKIAAKIKQLA